MKKALVMTFVLVLGLGLAAFAGPLRGSWNTDLVFNYDSTDLNLDITLFSSVAEVYYDVNSWTFGTVSAFDLTGFLDQYFLVHGSVGAFSFGSYLNFAPATSAFEMWLTGAQVSIAGVNLYSFFDLEDNGSGLLVGASGTSGTITIKGEAYFNLSNSLLYYAYGFSDIIDGFASPAYAFDPLHGCTSITIAEDAFTLQTDGYCVCWDGFDIEVNFPFGCLDNITVDNVAILAQFNTTYGFYRVRMHLTDIDLGVDWLWIDDFRLQWALQTKSLSRLDIDINLGGVCLTPYFALNPTAGYGNSGFLLTDLVLYALGMDYTWNGLSFHAMTLFDITNYALTWSGSPVRKDLAAAGYYCTNDWDEMFSIEYTADACCGGSFAFEVANWFDIDGAATGIFGWVETDIEVSIGVGSNVTFSALLNIDEATGFKYLGFGVDVTF